MPKSLIRIVSSCIALAALAVAITSQAQVNLRLGHYVTETHPMGAAAKQFADKVAARTNGAVKVQIFPANALGNPDEVLEQTRNGVIDMALPTTGQLGKYDKAFAAVSLPFLYDNLDQARKAIDGPMQEWLSGLAANSGFMLLGAWEYGFRNMTNNVRPINSPDDVKGLKIRTPPEIEIESAMQALGANVQKINFSELYLALSQGVVDGEENPIATIISIKLQEVQKYLAMTRHVYQAIFPVINPKSWAKLSPEQQRIVKEEIAAAGASERAMLQAQEDEAIAKLEAAGMKVTRPNLAPFRAQMAPAYAKISAYAGEANVRKVQQYVEQARGK